MKILPALFNQNIIMAKLSGELPAYFNADEMQLILNEDLRLNHYSTWFLIYFLYHTGARVSEAVGDLTAANGKEIPGCSVRDIDFHHRVIRMKTLKRNNHYRVVPLQPETLAVFAAYITDKEYSRDSKLFAFGRRAAYQKVKWACERAGFYDPPAIKKDGKSLKSKNRRNLPHSLRHSFAVAAISSGVPLSAVSEWLGHKDILNTLIYVKLIARDSAQFINQVKF